jgi:hypothetical protein
MNRKFHDLIGWMLCLLLALAGAYFASLPRRATVEGQVAVVSLDQSKVASLMMTGANFKVYARQKSPGRWWIEYERSNVKESKPLQDQSSSSAASHGEAGNGEAFLASPRFKDIISALMPMTAVRRVGVIEDKQRSDFGLADGVRSFEVLDADGVKLLALDVGKSLYGSRNLYIMNRADRNVYLVSGDWLSDFEKPELRFYERNLSAIPAEELQASTVIQNGKERRFSHTKRDAKGVLIWTPESGDETAGVNAGVWFSKFEQLKAATYATDTRENELKALPILFEVELVGLGSAQERVQVRKAQFGNQNEYWVTSSFLGWHVKVANTRAEVLERDIARLLGP